MTINDTRHITMNDSDIRNAIVDWMFRAHGVEAEPRHIEIGSRNIMGGWIPLNGYASAKIDIPITAMPTFEE